MKLTDHKILSLQVGEYPDDGCPGLYLRIGIRGANWYSNLRVGGKKINRKIGSCPPMNLNKARSEILKLKTGEVLTNSGEPLKTNHTVSDAINEFRDRHFSKIKPLTRRDYEKSCSWIIEECGDLPLSSFNRAFCQKLYDQLPGKGTSANRKLAAMKVAWGIAVNMDLTEDNPWNKVQKRSEAPRQQYAKSDELRAIMDSIQAEKNIETKAIYLLIITTACRRGEAESMKWADIDEKGIWTKSLTKNGKPHRVKIPEQTLELINQLPRNWENVFSFSGWSKSWARIKTRAGLKGKSLTIHDLRRSLSIELLKSGSAGIKAISNILGHSGSAITERVYAPYLGDNSDTVNSITGILQPLCASPNGREP